MAGYQEFELLELPLPWQPLEQVHLAGVEASLVKVIPRDGRAWTSRAPFTCRAVLVMVVLLEVFITE